MSQALLCFGGPLNERVYTIEDRAQGLTTFVPPPDMLGMSEPFDLHITARQIRYEVQRFGYHDDGKAWVGKCLVAPGYPMHRITDTLMAIAGMSRLLSYIAR